MIKKLIEQLEHNPSKIFLLDGFGAILSAFFLGVVLVKFENIFGIPASILYFLAVIPLFFAIYDFYFYQQDKHHLGPYLKGIAIMNVAYCILSIGLGLYHMEVIKFLGWCYIISEVMIIASMVFIEFKVSRQLILNMHNSK